MVRAGCDCCEGRGIECDIDGWEDVVVTQPIEQAGPAGELKHGRMHLRRVYGITLVLKFFNRSSDRGQMLWRPTRSALRITSYSGARTGCV